MQMSSAEYSESSLSYADEQCWVFWELIIICRWAVLSIDVFRSTQTMIRGCWWVSGTGRSSEAWFRPNGAAAWRSWDAGSNTTAIPSNSDSAGCLQRSCAQVHTHTRTHTDTDTHMLHTDTTHTHTHTHACSRTHARTHAHTHTHTHTRYTHATHVRTQARTHTHTHTHSVDFV